jgi:choline dehydrogenase-like flavoprotein
MHFDVLVLGGGTAGCVVASRLSEEPSRTVCLVEAGPDYGPYGDGRWPEDILDARRLAFSHSWETDREDRSQLRARILGGCSSHNACVVLEGARSDYDEWGHGWSYETIRPHLERARTQLRTRTIDRKELSPWHAVFAEQAPDAIVHDVNAVGMVRWNAAFAYLDPARSRSNLTILADTLVGRITHSVARATGAVTSAGELEADVVVLAAGAYGTPGILLRSGIDELPVGEGLQDHVGVGFGYEATDAYARDMDAFAAASPVTMGAVTLPVRSSRRADGVHDLFLFPAVDPEEDGYAISAAVFAMKPASRGSVRLRSDDPREPPAVDHGFLAAEADVAVLVEGVEAMRELVRTEPIRRYAARETRPGPEVDAETHVRAEARGFFHPSGTCALGRVTDGGGRVLGYDGLYVADASFIPSIPCANTNLTVAAVAERIAASIAAT